MQSNGLLSKLTPQKFHLLLGEVTSLLMVSKVHRKFQVRDIADIIMPALNLNQFKIYRNKNKQPIGLVTWARFSDAVEKEYLSGKVVLSESELQSGNQIYITDFIAPFGHTKKIIDDMLKTTFIKDEVNAIRFTEQGKSRKRLWKFYGVNYQKPTLH